jgi:hypothetical protein
MTGKQERALRKWLNGRLRSAERAAKKYARDQRYGDAQLTLGHAEAYAYTLVNLKSILARAERS